MTLIASSAFGQTDSVTISLETANKIEKRLSICDLKEAQIKSLLQSDSIQTARISNLKLELRLTNEKYQALHQTYEGTYDLAQKYYNRNKKKNRLIPLYIGASFLAGLFLAR